MRIAMIGATGLIGRSLALRLAGTHGLLLIGRRPARVPGAEERVAPITEWPALLAGERIDGAISTLGTTWKRAGSWDEFRAVDVDVVLDFAKAAQLAGARKMLIVSSVGALAGARNRYLALKGEVECQLEHIGFKRLDIVRPGLLRGHRGRDRRLAERIGIAISPVVNRLLRGRLDQFAAIDADRVAAAMAVLVGAEGDGRHIHHNRDLTVLAKLEARPGVCAKSPTSSPA